MFPAHSVPYNRITLKRILLLVLALFPVCLCAQQAAPLPEDSRSAGKLLLVLPFENRTTAPGLEWIGESFPEVLNQRMAEPSLFIISREDRLFAFDRLGIPATINASRATVFSIAQAMDVDYVVLGKYNYDGRTFSASAQVLDMDNLHLSTPATATGPLTQLINIQTELAYDLLGDLDLQKNLPGHDQFLARQSQVRLDSLENYVRGVLSQAQPDKIRRFKEAVRISPDYTFAKLQLARTYLNGRDYEQAATWFAKVPRNTAQGAEAAFFYGICEYQMGDMAKAEDAFKYVASKLPLIEVQNNLAVVTARRDKGAATEAFRKAVETDARDGDYRFNLAVVLQQSGDLAEAAKQAKEALAIRPTDNDARFLYDSLQHAQPVVTPAASGQPTAQPLRNFSLRLKRNYDETAFRQAELEMRNMEEIALAGKGAEKHAGAHIARGNQLLADGFAAEAEREFREAVVVDPALVDGHIGLARAAEAQNDVATAQQEANSSVRLKNNAPAHVVLARLAMRKSDFNTAMFELNLALTLDPHNADAQSLKREITAKNPNARAAVSD